MNSEDAASWEEFFVNFKEIMYPSFASFGISFENAIMMYENNMLKKGINHLTHLLEEDLEFLEKKEDEDEKEAWEK